MIVSLFFFGWGWNVSLSSWTGIMCTCRFFYVFADSKLPSERIFIVFAAGGGSLNIEGRLYMFCVFSIIGLNLSQFEMKFRCCLCFGDVWAVFQLHIVGLYWKRFNTFFFSLSLVSVTCYVLSKYVYCDSERNIFQNFMKKILTFFIVY